MERMKFKVWVVILVVGFSLGLLGQVRPYDRVSGEEQVWSMFRHDPYHTGVANEVEISPPLFLHFKINLGAETDSSPSFSNSALFIGDESGFMKCFDVSSGKLLWSVSKGDNVPIKSTPAVFDGKVYYGDDYGRLFCVSQENGDILWTYQAGDRIASSPLVVDIEGRKLLFFGSADRTVYCLDASNGTEVWQYTTNDSVYSSPVFYSGKVIVGSYDGYLYCFDAVKGNLVWKAELKNKLLSVSQKIYSSPAIDVSRRLVFVGSYNHYFYALNAEDGSVKWTFDAGSEIYASPIIYKDNVICPAVNGVICLNEDTGTERWRYTCSGNLFASPSLEFGYVMLSEKSGEFSCLNMQTGERIWNYTVASGSKSGPVPAYEHIFFYGDKTIYAFSDKSKVGQPILEVTPTKLDFGTVDKGSKLTQLLYVKNINRDVITGATIGDLQGTVSTDSDWITLDPLTFKSNSQTVSVTVDTSRFLEGQSYEGKIYVKTNGGNATIKVRISIKQNPNPSLSTSLKEIEFGNVDKGKILETKFYIENSHRDPVTGKWIGELKGTISSDKPWISVSPQSFESNKQLVNVKVDTSTLEEGKDYTGFINIMSNGGNISLSIHLIINKPLPPPVERKIIILQIGNNIFKVNDEIKTLDSPPIIKNGRTLVPIRAIVEAMGGSVSWDGTEKKVTITLKDTVIELWINKPQAKVNGELKWIDDTNHKVVPEIINGRTMLPLRFVAENLGAHVDWDGTTKTITITYPAP